MLWCPGTRAPGCLRRSQGHRPGLWKEQAEPGEASCRNHKAQRKDWTKNKSRPATRVKPIVEQDIPVHLQPQCGTCPFRALAAIVDDCGIGAVHDGPPCVVNAPAEIDVVVKNRIPFVKQA